MPKMKSHKGLRKRVKVTASGKVKRMRAFGGHLMSSKNGKRCRAIGRPAAMTATYTRKTRIALQEN